MKKRESIRDVGAQFRVGGARKRLGNVLGNVYGCHSTIFFDATP